MPDTLNQKADTGTSTRADTETSTRVIGSDQLHGAAARQRFIASMQPVIALQHPNLVRTHAVRERAETVAVVTDAVSAATLQSILTGDPFLSLAAVQSILSQVAMALDDAHAAGVVHGALSTRSILITPAGDAIVSNVGIAPALAIAGAREPVDDPSALAYASPEVVRGEPCTPSSDQYSLGAVAYELLAGRPPFGGSSARLRRAHLGKRPEPLGTLNLVHPDEWSHAVMRMLEKKPANRFWSLADAMERITPPNGAQSQGFRGTLGWLAQQQLSGAAMADAPIAQTQWLTGAPGVVRRRYMVTAAIGLVMIAIGSAAWSGQLPLLTRTRISNAAVQIEQRLTPEAIPTPLTKAAVPTALANVRAIPPSAPATTLSETVAKPTAETSPQPSRATRAIPRATPQEPPHTPIRETSHNTPRSTSHEAPRTTPVRDTRSVASYPVTPPFTAPQPAATTPAATPPAISPAAISPPAADPRLQVAEQPPAIVAAAPASPFPSAAPGSVSPPTSQPLTPAQADAAARTLVDQLRRGDLRSLGSTMVATSADAEFFDWLRGRSGDFQAGTPGPARVASFPDGSAQVTYSVPIIWTHASGARRTRAVTVAASVRPSPSGAKLASWLLAERFVP